MSEDPASTLLKLVLREDHSRGCEGRRYTCSCGYDIKVLEAAEAALAADRPQKYPVLVRVAKLAWERAKLRPRGITAADIAAIILEAKKG